MYTEVWTAILEKALAKALGSYYKLMFENNTINIQNITGLPFD